MKLCQLIAVVSGEKTHFDSALKELHRICQKVDLFGGFTRIYRSLEDGVEPLPPETKLVQKNVPDVLQELRALMCPYLNRIAWMDSANQMASADVKIGDKVLLPKVPITHLLFLEKRLDDLCKFVDTLPTLDPSEKWSGADSLPNVFQSETQMSLAKRKVLSHKTVYEATKEHPAQVEKWTEDIPVGKWETTKLSGAFSLTVKKAMLRRLHELQAAVKCAREEANGYQLEEQVDYAGKLFDYILEK